MNRVLFRDSVQLLLVFFLFFFYTSSQRGFLKVLLASWDDLTKDSAEWCFCSICHVFFFVAWYLLVGNRCILWKKKNMSLVTFWQRRTCTESTAPNVQSVNITALCRPDCTVSVFYWTGSAVWYLQLNSNLSTNIWSFQLHDLVLHQYSFPFQTFL